MTNVCRLCRPQKSMSKRLVSPPTIDRLVDGAADHQILSFLDAYSGYNQI